MKLPWRQRKRPAPRTQASPEAVASEPERVFAALHARGVRYVAIGGIAVQAHGHPRTTRDVDVLTDPSADNMERLAQALQDLDAELLGIDAHHLGIDPTSPADLASGANFTLKTSAGRLDVFTDPEHLKGSAVWADIDERALSIDIGSPAPIRVVGLDDLLRMKHAAGRERDLSDIAALTHRPNAQPGP